MRTRLLIAEADVALAELYDRFLQTNGYEVALARDGLECWSLLHADRPPDILVLDWELPWGGGAGILSRLQEDWADAMLPVVLTTTEDPTTDHFRQYMAGATACFQKPFSLAALANALKDARSYLQAAFQPGGRVRVRRGCLAGLTGELVETPWAGTWSVKVPSLGRGAYVRVAPDLLEPDDGPPEQAPRPVDDQ